jgi:hypothetical protein
MVESEEYMNMEDSEARDTTASEGAPDPETDQNKSSSKQTGHSVPNEAAQGGDDPNAVTSAGGGVTGDTGGSTGDAGGASQGGGSTGGGAGGASQGGGTGN